MNLCEALTLVRSELEQIGGDSVTFPAGPESARAAAKPIGASRRFVSAKLVHEISTVGTAGTRFVDVLWSPDTGVLIDNTTTLDPGDTIDVVSSEGPGFEEPRWWILNTWISRTTSANGTQRWRVLVGGRELATQVQLVNLQGGSSGVGRAWEMSMAAPAGQPMQIRWEGMALPISATLRTEIQAMGWIGPGADGIWSMPKILPTT